VLKWLTQIDLDRKKALIIYARSVGVVFMALRYNRLTINLMAALALAVTSPVAAATIFDSGEPAPINGTFSLFNVAPDNFQNIAARFTLTRTTSITRIESFFASVSFLPPLRNEFTVSVHRNSDIGQPGDVIASQTRSVPLLFRDGRNIGWAGGFTDGSLVLGPGDYWASFSVDPNNPANCFCALLSGAQTVVPVAAFRNQFTGTGWLVRQSSFGFRVFGDPLLSAVPEPSSWAMFIFGFGLIGAGLRTRRVRQHQLSS
jgi:PEP-CTERM motif